MNITYELLSDIALSIPGDFSIYQIIQTQVKILFKSPTMHVLTGHTSDEYDYITQDSILDIVHESDLAHVQYRVKQFVDGAENLDFALRITHKTRDFVWLNLKAKRLGELDGFPVVLVIFTPVSELADNFAFLINNTEKGIYVVEKKSYQLLFCNEHILTSFGKRDYISKPCYEFFIGLHAPCPWCSIPHMKDGFFCCDATYSPHAKRWYRIECRDMVWQGHDAIAIDGLDVTDTVQRNKTLELDKKGLEMTINNISIGIGVGELSGSSFKTLAINNRLKDLFHLTSMDLAAENKRLFASIHPDDQKDAYTLIHDCIYAHQDAKQEFRFMLEGHSEYSWFRCELRNIEKETASWLLFFSFTDMTEEKKIELQLRRNQKMYSAAVYETRLSVWEYDIARHCIHHNKNDTSTSFKHFGIKGDIENVPYSLLDMIEEDSRDIFLAMYKAIESGAPRASCEIWYKKKEGVERKCEQVSYNTVYDEHGHPVIAYGIAQDITRRKKEEKSYRNLIRTLGKSIGNSLSVVHLNLTKKRCLSVQSTNATVLERLNKESAAEFFDSVLQDICDTDIQAKARSMLVCEKLINEYHNGNGQLHIDYPVLFNDRQIRWMHGVITIIDNPFTDDIEAITYAVDITEEKKNQEIIEHVTNNNFDYIALINVATKKWEVRNYSATMNKYIHSTTYDYDYWRLKVIGKYVPDNLLKEYRENTSLKKIVTELCLHGKYVTMVQFTSEEGATRHQSRYTWLSPRHDYILVVRTDITASYITQQEQMNKLKKALQDTQKANQAKTEFVSRISHDIRTPISIISNMTAFAFADVHDTEKVLQDLQKIKSANAFLLSLINDVLDISKIDSGKIELKPEPYPYDDFIANIRNMFESMCAEKHITLTIISPKVDSVIIIDKIRFNQLILNLVSNAVKYTPEHGSVSFETICTYAIDGSFTLTLIVRDTGIGMSKAFQKKMFFPFTQEYENPLRSRAITGTGLGLPIVKKIVDLMNGSIDVQSEVGKGTTITVTLPMQTVKQSLEQVDSSQSAATAPLQQVSLSGRVLVAEDNMINREIARRILETLGLTVEMAEDGKQALEMFSTSAENYYRLIFMDIQMPIMTGYEATRAIRKCKHPRAKTIPIVAMTADAFSEAEEKSKKVGMTGYVTKPLDPVQLKEFLVKFFAKQDA